MRYRPVGASGATVSTLCLCLGNAQLDRGPTALKELIFSGLEAGVNAYHLEHAAPDLLQAAGEALGHVERNLLWVSLALGTGHGQNPPQRDFSPEQLTCTVDEALHDSGLGWFDAAILQEPAEDELSLAALNALKALRASHQVRFLGVHGADTVMDAYVSSGAFDLLYSPCSLDADWQVRARLRAASRRNMGIFIYDFDREVRAQALGSGLPKGQSAARFFGLIRPRPEVLTPSQAQPYDFLRHIPGRSARDLSLAYVMTDPSIACALIAPTDPEQITTMAEAVERDLPAGLSAQIQMARVG